MQSLEIVSINLWQILISLCNLAILYTLIKRFLYKPVKQVIAQRQNAIDEQYRAADEAEKAAMADRATYEAKLAGAQAEVEGMIHDATASANRRSERIVQEARDKAGAIVRQGQMEADLEKKKARSTIRREITDVSAALTEKLLGREMNDGDHRDLIDSFLQEMGDEQ